MSTEIKVPQLPESVTEATLVSWHKKPGDAVQRDENLVDIETDKVVLEVPAPVSGVLKEVKVEDGATVGADDVIALIEEGEAPATRKRSRKKSRPRKRKSPVKRHPPNPSRRKPRARTSRCRLPYAGWSRSTTSTPPLFRLQDVTDA